MTHAVYSIGPLELGHGANMTISVGVVVPSPELAGDPSGILYGSGILVLSEDALLECLEGFRVMGLIIFAYILIQCNLAPSNQSCHTAVHYTAHLGESVTPRLNRSLLSCIHRKCVAGGPLILSSQPAGLRRSIKEPTLST